MINFASKKPSSRIRKRNKCLDDCNKIPSYNFEGLPAIYCSPHSKKGMIDVVHKKCIEHGCEKNPTYNFKGLVILN